MFKIIGLVIAFAKYLSALMAILKEFGQLVEMLKHVWQEQKTSELPAVKKVQNTLQDTHAVIQAHIDPAVQLKIVPAKTTASASSGFTHSAPPRRHAFTDWSFSKVKPDPRLEKIIKDCEAPTPKPRNEREPGQKHVSLIDGAITND